MASPAGTRFETDVVKYLRAQGLGADKPRQKRVHDVGDVWVGEDVLLQAKAWKNIATALREGTADAQDQAVHARRPYGLAVIKKPRGAIKDAYVAMPLHVFASLMAARQSPGSEVV